MQEALPRTGCSAAFAGAMIIGPPAQRRFADSVFILRVNTGRVFISHNERHCARNTPVRGTLMRHFLRPPATPSALPCCVPARPAIALLIACPRTP